MMGALTFFGLNSQKNESDNQKPQKVLVEKKIAKVKKPAVQISYQTDTLQNFTSVMLYNLNNRIYRHFKKDVELYRMRLHLFVHEAWHTHNNNLKYRSLVFSPQEYRKLCIHDEISANLCSLNSLILEYQLTDDKAEFLKKYTVPRGYYSFYFNEVKKGNIDPSSSDSIMHEKDLKLRVNGIIKTWMERSYSGYSERQQRRVYSYLKRAGIHENQDIRYKKILHGMYSMGGIDFWKYADKDIEVNDISIMSSLNRIKSLPKKGKDMIDEITPYLPLIEKISDDKQRCSALQHLIISAEMKTEIKKHNYMVDNQVATILYNKIKTKYAKDETFAEFANDACLMTKKLMYMADDDLSVNNFINTVYTCNDINLNKIINDFDFDNIPYKGHLISNDYTSKYFNLLNYNPNANIEDKILLHSEAKSSKQPTPNKNNSAGGTTKPHRSEIQYLNIPNFEEPILTDNSPLVLNGLRQVFDDFYSLPQVYEISDNSAYKWKITPTKSNGREK